ncbi:AEC family permease [Brochothrix campestris FSL F6-1037]|uniref:AEC family permease n=2 Tax=Brochothrix campestris TaxID=2757 RepID=W7CLZ9_9LIST|nr:AEC family permease [Brochothrix campestris FSL F6-1037]
MAVLLQGAEGILTILVMIALGYYLCSKKWFDDRTTGVIVRLIIMVALPLYMVNNILTDFTRSQLIDLIPGLIYPFISMAVMFLLSLLAVKVVGVNEGRRGTFKSMFLNSNTIFIGLPVNLALFGTTSLPYVLIYYMANTICFWTLGAYLIAKDGEHELERPSLKVTLSRVFSPPFLAFLVAVALLMFNVKLPTFIMADMNYLGSMTTPLSMLFIGICIFNAGLENVRLTKDAWGILLGRFILSPFVMLCIVYYADIPQLMKEVFIIQAAMPVMTNAPVIAKVSGADSDYAAIMVTLSTLTALIAIPFLLLAVSNIQF